MHFIARQRGLTMIELMIAMAIGLLIMLGMGSLFMQTKQSFRQDELIATMQEDARFALTELSRDVAMAGFWASLVDGTLITNAVGLPAIADVNPTKYFSYAAPAIGQDDVSSATTAFDWSTGLDDFQPDSDAISIHRLEGDVTPNAVVEGSTSAEAIAADKSYFLQTNGAIGVMLSGSTAPSASVPSPYEYWEYTPVIYYVRTFCRNGDGVPSLVRRYLKDGVATTECIAQGIESLQIQYGLDTSEDGIPDRYVDGLTEAQAPQLAAIRFHLLARSVNADTRYTNDKLYTFANYTLDKSATGAADHFYRRVYTTTIETRNPTATRLID